MSNKVLLSSFKRLAYLSAASVYVLIVLGGVVTSTGSGRACPDWPLCHGQVIPPLTTSIMIEYTHRLWTLVVTGTIIAMAVSAWRRPKKPFLNLLLSSLSVLLLFAQVIMGMITVQSGSSPAIVATHLALASALFGLVVANAALISRSDVLKDHS